MTRIGCTLMCEQSDPRDLVPFGGGWKPHAEIGTGGVAAPGQLVRKADVAHAIPCGPDPDLLAPTLRALSRRHETEDDAPEQPFRTG